MSKPKVIGLTFKKFAEKMKPKRRQKRKKDVFLLQDLLRGKQRIAAAVRSADQELYIKCSIDRYKGTTNPERAVKEINQKIERGVLQWHAQDQKQKLKRKLEFDKRKQIEAKPERKITSSWLGRYAYPRKLTEVEKTYNIEAFKKARDLALKNKIAELGSPELTTQFVAYCNAVIQQKQN